jgi:hypothetical protein
VQTCTEDPHCTVCPIARSCAGRDTEPSTAAREIGGQVGPSGEPQVGPV